MVKMLKVSKVSDYENVEDIFKTKEWQEFAKNLAEKNMKEIIYLCISNNIVVAKYLKKTGYTRILIKRQEMFDHQFFTRDKGENTNCQC